VSDSPQSEGTQPIEADPAVGPQPGDVIEARYRYKLERRLGKGGFSSVFLAQRLDAVSASAEVAVKVLAPTTGKHARTTLKRELGALLSIEHPGIPRLYDWNVDTEPSFAVLEYFPGGSLADVWPVIGKFDEQQTWRLMSDLLSALAAAHRASILHLDVKPSNVLLNGNGGFVLTDFGVAQAPRMSRGMLQQGHLLVGLGTHGYRAPEQADHSLGSFDLRTDLWGVGATAWALYTGIDLNKRQDVLRHKEPGNIYGLKRLSEVRLNCPPPLEELVMGLLFIDPARRPGGAGEVLSRIRAIADGFGLDNRTVAAARRESADPDDIRALVESLVDPLWSSICSSPAFQPYFVKFADGEEISSCGTQTHHTYLLLRGQVAVERDGKTLAVESREGTFLCAVSTFTGVPRRVTLRAWGEVWVCIFNEAELEQLVTCNPAVAVRMIRILANRIASAPPRGG
jgi:serine/threonine protein kinase